jgi:glutamine synthetase
VDVAGASVAECGHQVAAVCDTPYRPVVTDVDRPERVVGDLGAGSCDVFLCFYVMEVEHRGVDGSANPYLASAALLAAGLDGVERELDPGEPVHDDLFALPAEEVARRGIAHLPRTLDAAVSELVGDNVLREALGRVPGGDFIDYYARIKQAEFDEYHASVSDWEIERYLTLV